VRRLRRANPLANRGDAVLSASDLSILSRPAARLTPGNFITMQLNEIFKLVCNLSIGVSDHR